MKRMVNLENFKDFLFYKKFLFLFTLFLPIFLFSQQKNPVSPTNPQEEKNVATQASKFKREESPYLSYNIYNVLNLIKDVKYTSLGPMWELEHVAYNCRDLGYCTDSKEELESFFKRFPAFRETYEIFKKHNEKFEKYCLNCKPPCGMCHSEKVAYNLEAIERDGLSYGLSEKDKKENFKGIMEVSKPVPVNDIFDTYEKAKKMEITDTVFEGIKWPINKGRHLFSLEEEDPHVCNNKDPDCYDWGKITVDHYRLEGLKLDLRAGKDVIAPPSAIVFDVEKGPLLTEVMKGMYSYRPDAWTDRRIAYLKVGPLYLEFHEEDTFDIIARIKWEGDKYYSTGYGMTSILETPSYYSHLTDHWEYLYKPLYPKVREVFEDMKFVRIFSLQIFKDNPKIRAYGIMVPPGVAAVVRDSPKEEVPGYNYVKNTKEELDRLSGKTPNIKEYTIQEEGRNPDEYGEWKHDKISKVITKFGGLFLVYPKKADGSEWAAELVSPSYCQYERGGIGAVIPSSWIEEGYDGQIYYDRTSPTHWKAILDGDPSLILEDYKNALTRNHFLFSEGGVYNFKKNEKGEIWISSIKRYLSWYPAELEKEMKEMLNQINNEKTNNEKTNNEK